MKWYAKNSADRGQGLVIDEADGRNVAVAYERKDTALLAAAPELLEALQSVLASVPFANYRGDGELEECETRVRAALAKAEGK